MQQGETEIQPIDLNREISFPGDVSFDANALILKGMYADQLSAYRARRIWASTLQTCFLLEQGHDFAISISSDLQSGQFTLSCSFNSACARYAFWRLTNEQAPEAQFMIETAHIPNADSKRGDLMGAPDLHSGFEDELDFLGLEITRGRPQPTLLNRLKSALRTLITKE